MNLRNEIKIKQGVRTDQDKITKKSIRKNFFKKEKRT